MRNVNRIVALEEWKVVMMTKEEGNWFLVFGEGEGTNS